jgi:zinc/manganese transport system substrate-binding protein
VACSAPGANDREGRLILVCLRISLVLTTLLLTTTHAHAVDRIMVVATFSVIGDMLANVGGDHIITKTIVGSDGDCELYQPTPADVATIASARAVFLNGLNDEF